MILDPSLDDPIMIFKNKDIRKLKLLTNITLLKSYLHGININTS